MIMPIKVSQLMAISLLLLVGCSGKSVVESDVSGCWAREKFTSYANGGSVYWKETYQLEPRGTFRRNNISHIIPAPIGQVEPHNDSGEWIIDDGHVVIQFEDRDRVILKVFSQYELARHWSIKT